MHKEKNPIISDEFLDELVKSTSYMGSRQKNNLRKP